MTARIVVIALTGVGTVVEFFGIVTVAGRQDDLNRIIRQLRARYRDHKSDRAADLKRYFPTLRSRIPGLPVFDTVSPGVVFARGGTVTARSSVSAKLTVERGSIEGRVADLESGLARLEEGHTDLRARDDKLDSRITDIEDRLPDDIAEAVKDPWRGIVLLFIGLSCLATAGIVGAFT